MYVLPLINLGLCWGGTLAEGEIPGCSPSVWNQQLLLCMMNSPNCTCTHNNKQSCVTDSLATPTEHDIAWLHVYVSVRVHVYMYLHAYKNLCKLFTNIHHSGELLEVSLVCLYRYSNQRNDTHVHVHVHVRPWYIYWGSSSLKIELSSDVVVLLCLVSSTEYEDRVGALVIYM